MTCFQKRNTGSIAVRLIRKLRIRTHFDKCSVHRAVTWFMLLFRHNSDVSCFCCSCTYRNTSAKCRNNTARFHRTVVDDFLNAVLICATENGTEEYIWSPEVEISGGYFRTPNEVRIMGYRLYRPTDTVQSTWCLVFPKTRGVSPEWIVLATPMR